MAALVTIPGGIGDPAAIGRPRGRVLEGPVAGGESGGGASTGRRDPDPAHGLEGDARPVRRQSVPPEHSGIEGPIVNAEIRARHLRDGALHAGREGHRGDLAARHIQPANLPALGENDAGAVRGPAVTRQDAERLDALRVVHRDRVHRHMLAPGLQIPDPEGGAGSEGVAPVGDGAARDPPREGQVAAVRGDLGAVGASARRAHLLCRGPAGDVDDLAAAEVLAPHLPVARQRVAALEARRPGVHVEVEISAVPRGRGPGGLGLVVDDLNSLPAVPVVHPDAPAVPARGGVLPAHEDVVPVRRPCGLHRPDGAIDEHRTRVGPVGVHDPQVVLPLPVADEGDRRPVGRIPGMVVGGDPRPAGEQLGLAARVRRDAVDVAQQVEGDPAAVRGDVQRHPGPLLGSEVDVAGLAPGEGHIPLVPVARTPGFLGGERKHGSHDREHGHGGPPHDGEGDKDAPGRPARGDENSRKQLDRVKRKGRAHGCSLGVYGVASVTGGVPRFSTRVPGRHLWR